jgi:hypothetical protein
MRWCRCWSSAVGDAWRAIAPEGAGAAWAPLPRSPTSPDSVTSAFRRRPALPKLAVPCIAHPRHLHAPALGHCSPACATRRWSRGCPPRPTLRTAVGAGRDAHSRRPAAGERLRRAVSAHDQLQRRARCCICRSPLELTAIHDACAALPDGHAPAGSTVAGPKRLHSPRMTPTRHYQQLQRPSMRSRQQTRALPLRRRASQPSHHARLTAPQSRCAGTRLR